MCLGFLFVCFVVRGPLTVVASPAAEHRLWMLTGPAAPRHVGSSRTGARTRGPCIGRRTLNHCATREALSIFKSYFLNGCSRAYLIPLNSSECALALY